MIKRIVVLTVLIIFTLSSNVEASSKVWFYACKNCKAYTKSKMKVCKYCKVKVKGTIIKIKRRY